MLQRIQTVYLLAATLLYFFMINHPVSRITVSEELILEMDVLKIDAVIGEGFTPVSVWPFTALLIIVMALGVTALVLYKKRTLQMRICMFNIFLMLGLVALIWFYTKFTVDGLEGDQTLFLWPIVVPFISAILTYLAMKAIQKDDAIIKSYERIR